MNLFDQLRSRRRFWKQLALSRMAKETKLNLPSLGAESN
jgi:hypothetical protein